MRQDSQRVELSSQRLPVVTALPCPASNSNSRRRELRRDSRRVKPALLTRKAEEKHKFHRKNEVDEVDEVNEVDEERQREEVFPVHWSKSSSPSATQRSTSPLYSMPSSISTRRGRSGHIAPLSRHVVDQHKHLTDYRYSAHPSITPQPPAESSVSSHHDSPLPLQTQRHPHPIHLKHEARENTYKQHDSSDRTNEQSDAIDLDTSPKNKPTQHLPSLSNTTSEAIDQLHPAMRCSCCSQLYRLSETHKQPLLLSCGHSMCRACAMTSKEKDALPCALDCFPTPLLNGQVSSLPINDALVRMIQDKSDHWKAGTLDLSHCTIHPDHPLTLFCHDCVELICLACTSPFFNASSSNNPPVSSDFHLRGSIPFAYVTKSSHVNHSSSKIEEMEKVWLEARLNESIKRQFAQEMATIQAQLTDLGSHLYTQEKAFVTQQNTIKAHFDRLRKTLFRILSEKESVLLEKSKEERAKHTRVIEQDRMALARDVNLLRTLNIEQEMKEQNFHRHHSTLHSLERERLATLHWQVEMLRVIKNERHLTSRECRHVSNCCLDSTHYLHLEMEKAGLALRSALADSQLIDSPPSSATLIVQLVKSKLVRNEVLLTWKPAITENVHEWQLQLALLPFAEAGKHRISTMNSSLEDADDLIGLASLCYTFQQGNDEVPLKLSSIRSASQHHQWTSLYTGMQTVFTVEEPEYDRLYLFRLRGVNKLGEGEWTYAQFSPQPMTSLHLFSYVHDHNGLFYLLGCKENSTYTNPALSGLIRVCMSSQHPNSAEPTQLLSRSAGKTIASLSLPASFLNIDISPTSSSLCSFIIQTFSISHSTHEEWSKRGMRHWRLLASEDDRDYKVLGEYKRHERLLQSNRWSDISFPCGTLDMTTVCDVDVERSRNSGQGFRYFRIQQVGNNLDGDHALCLSSIEFYGLWIHRA